MGQRGRAFDGIRVRIGDSGRRAGGWRLGQKVRRQAVNFYKGNWHKVLIVCAVGLGISGLAWVLVPDPHRGVLTGALLASVIWILLAIGTIHGGWLHDYLGQMGEQLTGAELKHLKRQSFIVEHSLSKGPTDDVDHVAIGPDRVLVIDSKWRTKPWDLDACDAPDLLRAVSRLRDEARRIQHVLAAAGVDTVQPLIFLWGPRDRLPQDHPITEIRGVQVVLPQLEPAWAARLRAIQPQSVDVDYAQQLLREHFDAFESGHRMSPALARKSTNS